MINCPECHKEISQQAKLCPHCGYAPQSPRRSLTMRAPMVGAVLYTILMVIYQTSYFRTTMGTIQFLAGILCVALFVAAIYAKITPALLQLAFSVVFAAGAFLLAFDYNISRLSLNFVDGMFSHYIYSESRGVVLAVFQVIAMSAVALSLFLLFTSRRGAVTGAVALSVAGVAGLISSVYDMVYLSSRWGTSTSLTSFEFWFGLATCAFFLTGAMYLLAAPKGQEGAVRDA